MHADPELPLSPAFCGTLLSSGSPGVTRVEGAGTPHVPLTCLPTRQHAGDRFSVSYTGSRADIDGGGTVVILGQPRWAGAGEPRPEPGHTAAQWVARLYAVHGIDLLRHLHGAFALALYDEKRDLLYAAIDRVGQCQLYYALNNGRFSFGTAARPVLENAELHNELEPQGIYNYVYFHMVPSPGTIYKGLRKLPAAHYLCLDGSGLSTKCYWSPSFRETPDRSMQEAATALRGHLREAVRRQLPVEGKVGSFLSGGLDSSSVSGILAEETNGGAEAFAIGFDAAGYDEMAYARLTANHFGIRLNELYVTPEDVVAALPLIATSYAEPFGNSSALPAWFCARAAKRSGVQVLLAGDGGDEFFAGNERYLSQNVFENYLRIPRFIRRGLVEAAVSVLPESLPLIRKGRSFLAQANTPLPDRLQAYNFLHRHLPDEVFSTGFLRDVSTAEPLEVLRAVYHRPVAANTLNRMMYSDWQFTLADNDLRKVSHMAAISGIDVRYPLLDDELVEFSCGIPGEWKLRGGQLRYFFKESLRGWLPDGTINKKKHGFGLPFGVWMKSHRPLQELAYENILTLKDREILNAAFLDSLIEMHRSGHAAYYGELIWILTVFELWLAAHS